MREQLREELLSIIADIGDLEHANSSTLLQIQANITRIIAVVELEAENKAEKKLKAARELVVDALEAIQRDRSPDKELSQAVKELKDAVEIL